MIRNTDEAYGLAAKSFHWLIALMVLALLCAGFTMIVLPASPGKLFLYGLHKSFGIAVLGLVVLRLSWRLACGVPGELATHRQWEKHLAKAAHFLLYLCLFVMPLSGWAMSSTGGFPAGFFGLFELPALTAKDEDLFRLARLVHNFTAWALIGLVALHMAGAFKHHLIDRDITLKRMTYPALGIRGGLAMAVFFGGVLALAAGLAYRAAGDAAPPAATVKAKENAGVDAGIAADAARASWHILREQSALKFEATQNGQVFTGAFENFEGRIHFDPDAPENAYALIRIDISSLDTGSGERDEQALSAEWFAAGEYPQAVFETRSFQKGEGPDRYIAKAGLTIRGVEMLVTLPFQLEISEGGNGVREARMEAEITLKRLDFGIGRGAWEAADVIGNEVRITVDLRAEQAPPL